MTKQDKEQERFRRCCKEVFSSEAGKFVLEYMANAYVYPTAMCSTPELTAYTLGQKEFVQRFIDYSRFDKTTNTYQEN